MNHENLQLVQRTAKRDKKNKELMKQTENEITQS